MGGKVTLAISKKNLHKRLGTSRTARTDINTGAAVGDVQIAIMVEVTDGRWVEAVGPIESDEKRKAGSGVELIPGGAERYRAVGMKASVLIEVLIERQVGKSVAIEIGAVYPHGFMEWVSDAGEGKRRAEKSEPSVEKHLNATVIADRDVLSAISVE